MDGFNTFFCSPSLIPWLTFHFPFLFTITSSLASILAFESESEIESERESEKFFFQDFTTEHTQQQMYSCSMGKAFNIVQCTLHIYVGCYYIIWHCIAYIHIILIVVMLERCVCVSTVYSDWTVATAAHLRKKTRALTAQYQNTNVYLVLLKWTEKNEKNFEWEWEREVMQDYWIESTCKNYHCAIEMASVFSFPAPPISISPGFIIDIHAHVHCL